MQQRIVEIASDGIHLSAFRGFMKISRQDEELGRVPFADIGAVILRGHGSTLSVNLCTRLSDAGAPLVICGSNQAPSSLLWPVRGHYEQGRRMEAQIASMKISSVFEAKLVSRLRKNRASSSCSRRSQPVFQWPKAGFPFFFQPVTAHQN